MPSAMELLCKLPKAIRDFLIPLEDLGERERDFLSSVSAMKDALLRRQVKQREGNQTEGVLSGMNKCLAFFFDNTVKTITGATSNGLSLLLLTLLMEIAACLTCYFVNQLILITNLIK